MATRKKLKKSEKKKKKIKKNCCETEVTAFCVCVFDAEQHLISSLVLTKVKNKLKQGKTT